MNKNLMDWNEFLGWEAASRDTIDFKKLAQYRLNAEKDKARLSEIIGAAKNAEYKEIELRLSETQQEINKLTEEIKTEALNAYYETGSKQLPGVTIKVMTKFSCIDADAARRYAIEKDQSLLLVDWKAFEAEAKKLYGTNYEFPFYKQELTPQAQIKSDLSEFLNA